MIAKPFSSSSAVVLLEKVIRKNYEMFRHETSMRKPFFSKSIYSSSFSKCSEQINVESFGRYFSFCPR